MVGRPTGEAWTIMNDSENAMDPMVVVRRLQDATNRHDLDALADCFTVEYLSEIPTHPSRSFRGNEQVRRNWSQILAGVPDLHSELVRHAVSGSEVWAEWEWTGTRRDGAAHLMRGTTILGIEGDRIGWARFYMEPVMEDGVDVEASVRRTVTAGQVPASGAAAANGWVSASGSGPVGGAPVDGSGPVDGLGPVDGSAPRPPGAGSR